MIEDKKIIKFDSSYKLSNQQRAYSKLLQKKIKYIKQQGKIPYEIKVFYMAEFFKLHKNKEYEEVIKDCLSLFSESDKMIKKQTINKKIHIKAVKQEPAIIMTNEDTTKLINSIFKF